MKLLKCGVIAVLAGTVALFGDQTRIWTNISTTTMPASRTPPTPAGCA